MKTSFHNRPPPAQPRQTLRLSVPPPPQATHAANILPPPPPGVKTQTRVPPPPPPSSSYSTGGIGSNTNSITGNGHLVSPAFTQSVKGATNERLQQLTQLLQMEVLVSKFMGNPAAAERAQAKLGVVQGELSNRKAIEKQKTEFASSIKGMSAEQLESARSKEFLNLFACTLKGDTAGAAIAQSKLEMIDGETTRRETDLSRFSTELSGMSEEQLEDAGNELAGQLLKLIFNPSPQTSQVESLFSRFGILLGEQVGRGLKSAANDWLFSK